MTGKPLIYSREAPRSRTRHPGSQASRPGTRGHPPADAFAKGIRTTIPKLKSKEIKGERKE